MNFHSYWWAQITGPCRLRQTKDAIWQKSSNCYLRLQTNWKHQSFCWQKQEAAWSSFITRLMVVRWLLKILSDLQINICSPGRDRKYLRTNNKIFRRLTIQHLLLIVFILNNLRKYLKDIQNTEYCYLMRLVVRGDGYSLVRFLLIIMSVSITKSSSVPC